jgi:hypothetical protein
MEICYSLHGKPAVILINIYNVFSSHRPVDDLKIFARCPVLVNFLLLRSPVVSSIIPAKLEALMMLTPEISCN